ncbi:glycyl-radical enzyme activating protein [Spirochaetia bacterium]|nr:glycyl-radical enzyme activating protein [Spirochaetia bacterium]
MGVVTDIQRFSLKDGPGIRTTVFLKGCNASCLWCHNPETFSPLPEVLVYPERCVKCGTCVEFDPARAGSLPPPRESLNLNAVSRCYSGALSAAGQELSAEAVMDEILQDQDYYRNSGGGITLSGGDALLQDAFCKEILMACKEHGIDTAVETNLAYDFSRLQGLLPLLDLVMGDLKILDPQKHREYTGIDNKMILENIQKLGETGKAHIVRTPIIPGVNDSPEEIAAIAGFLTARPGARGLLYYELLNFNPLGASKYDALSVKNPFREMRPLEAAEMEALGAAAAKSGIPLRTG